MDAGYVTRIMPLIQERAKILAEVPELTEFFLTDNLDYDASLLLGKIERAEAIAALRASLDKIEGLANWDSAYLESVFRPLAEELNLKTGVFFGILRVAITGRTATPPLFQTMEVLGKERSVRRLKAALDKLQG